MSNWAFINENRIGICLGLVVVALIFIVIGHAFRDQIQNVLKQEICKFPECSIDYWSVSHFLLFGLFGFLIPGYHLTAFTIGASFEFTEDYLSADENTLFADCSKPCGREDGMCGDNDSRKTWCNGYQDGYWYSNMTDSFVNLIGYTLGSAIRTTLLPDTLTM
jgi:hypothetical protein